jgi:predicted transcriptional regulator
VKVEKRQKYDLYAEILDFCKEPRRSWFLVRTVNSNFTCMGDLLADLLMAGMLEETERTYKTTELGRGWLAAWTEVKKYGL